MEEFLISIMSLFFLLCLSPKQLFASVNNTTDYKSLVAFKNQFLEQSRSSSSSSSAIFFNSWNDTNYFCSWEGVTCGLKHSDRVIVLDLSSCGLTGPLPPPIANLTFLKRLDLSNNSLYGEIPLNLARLQRLQHLNLSFNSFHGDLHAILTTNNSVFQVLDLSYNKLSGKIPSFINSMLSLNYLGLNNNDIIGIIPPSIGNLTSLESLYALYNNLEGNLPLEIGGLRSLKIFKVGENNLSGSIPSSFYNLSSLQIISLATNHFSGYIAANIAKAFPNLEIFYIDSNHFIGSLDQVLQNATSLVRLDIGINNFTGVVPPDLGKMHNLIYLDMQQNELKASDAQDWRFLDSLTNCTSLEMLSLYRNNIGGMLPKSFRNLSLELRDITLGLNYIQGSIPFELGKYTNLINFGMEGNLLEGSIPKSIGKLKKLQFLSLDYNGLTGIIPYSLGNLTRLNILWLGSNQLMGHIPSTLKNLQILNNLDLSHNNLTGLIPIELFLIPTFSNYLDLSYNFFIGSLALEVGLLVNLMSLDISHNNLIGEMPETLGHCQLLVELYMEYNFFHGSIPISLSNMKSIENIDLSHNNLSGTIPQTLQNLTLLKQLNLSFNHLEGEVPYDGVFANSSKISLIGNEKLCGGILKLHLSKCVVQSLSTKRSHHLIKILVPIISILIVLFALLVWYIFSCKKQKQSDQRRNSPDSYLSTPFPRISYVKLAKATNDFSTSYLVGNGRYGYVYRGTLRDYQATVAIKVFNLEVHGAFKSFTSECDALRSIRHRNLVRILSSCSSIDHQGRDFKALIFEFMPKGNLDMWLHQEYKSSGDNVLSLEMRLNIAINIAEALEYLHHSCEPSIIHCDIKPSNILLDNNMIAHVGDFGLSRILYEATSMSLEDYSDNSMIKGTIGYVAPEYGGGARPSITADVYSFGIILLEMLTGRRPTDVIFKDNINLYNHVKMVFPYGIKDIIDLKMFTKEQRDYDMSSCQSIKKCLLSWAEVGLLCSNSIPEERPSMRDIAIKLHAIGVSYLQSDENMELSKKDEPNNDS